MRYRNTSFLNNKSCLLAALGGFRQASFIHVSTQSNISIIRIPGNMNNRIERV